MRFSIRWMVAVCLLASASGAIAQEGSNFEDSYSRKIGWTLFAEYSPTSTHILMGRAQDRELVDAGGALTLRVARFWGSALNYQIEVRPVLFESDPLGITETSGTYTIAGQGPLQEQNVQASVVPGSCTPASGQISFSIPGEESYVGTYTIKCGRQWTFGQSFSPIGFKYSLLTRHKLQPFVIGTLGYMYTSRPVPLPQAESFNFAFDFGAGIELYRSKKRSVSIECRYHHFSNRDTAEANPGVDNVMYKLSYSFGR